jgi:hypothetical protein
MRKRMHGMRGRMANLLRKERRVFVRKERKKWKNVSYLCYPTKGNCAEWWDLILHRNSATLRKRHSASPLQSQPQQNPFFRLANLNVRKPVTPLLSNEISGVWCSPFDSRCLESISLLSLPPSTPFIRTLVHRCFTMEPEPEENPYDAIEYGDFSSYFRHKRQKLLLQQEEMWVFPSPLITSHMNNQPSSPSVNTYSRLLLYFISAALAPSDMAQIFEGVIVYVNGYTNPPIHGAFLDILYTNQRELDSLHDSFFFFPSRRYPQHDCTARWGSQNACIS